VDKGSALHVMVDYGINMDIKQNYPFIKHGALALLRALKERDSYTKGHSMRVVEISRRIGRACGLKSSELDILSAGAIFHDVGKIGIPDKILFKPTAFTQDELRVMQTHSEKSEILVKDLELDNTEEIAQAVRSHHEYYNGQGYPDGLKGENILIYSRIISVADSFDAMSMPRPYRNARHQGEAVDIINQESGSKLDPYVVGKLAYMVEQNQLDTPLH